MPWWSWILGCMFLLGAELAAPGGFFLVFFGAGALLIGLVVALLPEIPAWAQWAGFSILSVLLLLAFRQRMVQAFRRAGPDPVNTVVGEVAVALEALGADDQGRVELRGTSWSAKNVGSTPIEIGARCRVVREEGLTVDVEAE